MNLKTIAIIAFTVINITTKSSEQAQPRQTGLLNRIARFFFKAPNGKQIKQKLSNQRLSGNIFEYQISTNLDAQAAFTHYQNVVSPLQTNPDRLAALQNNTNTWADTLEYDKKVALEEAKIHTALQKLVFVAEGCNEELPTPNFDELDYKLTRVQNNYAKYIRSMEKKLKQIAPENSSSQDESNLIIKRYNVLTNYKKTLSTMVQDFYNDK